MKVETQAEAAKRLRKKITKRKCRVRKLRAQVSAATAKIRRNERRLWREKALLEEMEMPTSKAEQIVANCVERLRKKSVECHERMERELEEAGSSCRFSDVPTHAVDDFEVLTPGLAAALQQHSRSGRCWTGIETPIDEGVDEFGVEFCSLLPEERRAIKKLCIRWTTTVDVPDGDTERFNEKGEKIKNKDE
ncbi:hypothetical protein [Mollivirus kamchatka]|nr:hypothetical protein [Mollivirus kamchatka]